MNNGTISTIINIYNLDFLNKNKYFNDRLTFFIVKIQNAHTESKKNPVSVKHFNVIKE